MAVPRRAREGTIHLQAATTASCPYTTQSSQPRLAVPQRPGIWLFFLFGFSFGEGESVFDDLGDAAVAGFGRAVIEDGEQVAAAVRRGHTLPSGEGARLAGERQLQNGREFTFSFHGGKQLFGDLFGATNARCGAFYLRNQVGDPFAG